MRATQLGHTDLRVSTIAHGYAGQAEAARAADAERWREISVLTDVTASASLPELPL